MFLVEANVQPSLFLFDQWRHCCYVLFCIFSFILTSSEPLFSSFLELHLESAITSPLAHYCLKLCQVNVLL
uniref:Hypothetical secreted peptide n=1 Tax=Glossina morsitans morsitans TaxID=37546 RepID=D3TSI4_GLOMM